MNKNYKVIKINGFRGILIALFVIGCAITGFVVFPGWVFMHIWNYAASLFVNIPAMELIHGIILWAIIALSIYGLNSNRFLIGFASPKVLQEEQIRGIMDKVKGNAKNPDKEITQQINDKEADQECLNKNESVPVETLEEVIDSFDELRK